MMWLTLQNSTTNNHHNMKKSILFIIMLLMTMPVFAQKVSIYGVVSDMEDGSPIVGPPSYPKTRTEHR